MRKLSVMSVSLLLAAAGCGGPADPNPSADPAAVSAPAAPAAGTSGATAPGAGTSGTSGTSGATAPRPAGSVGPAGPVPPPRTRLTIAAAGDLLVHPPLTDQAAADARAAGRDGYDFTRVLAAVRPLVSPADLAICHLETPLAPPTGPFTGYPDFSVPPQLADAAAWAGFDTCSTASNHSLDTGVAGIDRTLENLDRVGVRHAGTARTEREAARPTILDVAGVPVAHLSYTFSLNGIPLPTGRPWAANLIDPDAIGAEARRAREQGAQIVVLSLHWGTEYQNEPDDGQLALARDLLDAPEIDLIVGHHAHVVQPFEKIGTKWVAYGLGNLTTRFPDGSDERTQDSMVPVFTFTRAASGRWAVTAVDVHATWMEYRPAARVVDLAARIGDTELPVSQRAGYTRTRERIIGHLDLRDARRNGLRVRD